MNRTHFSYILFLLFAVITCFFYTAGNYILYFQETQSLFISGKDFFKVYLQRPGGLVEYVAGFLAQFYYSRIAGSIIVSLVLLLPALILTGCYPARRENEKFHPIAIIIPSLILVILQANYYHLMVYNLGFVVVLLLYSLSGYLQNSGLKFIPGILFPLAYFVTGAYAFIFLILYVVYQLSESGKDSFLLAVLMTLSTGFSLLISWKLVFSQPFLQLLLNPAPLLKDGTYRIMIISLTLYLIFYPLIIKTLNKLPNKNIKKPVFQLVGLTISIIITALITLKIYNPQTARVVEIEKLAFAGKFEEAIKIHERTPSRNLIGEYFYNFALSETGQLCDRLFSAPQDFGTGALVLPWSDDHLNRGAYFYYSIGLTNEAHRWAYEEMVVYGLRPQNIDLLIKTSLINGDYRMVKKYAGILKKTMFYKKRATKYEEMAENPSLIKTDKELGPKISILPQKEFFIKFNEPQANLPLLLDANPGNRNALEYYMAGLLLTKNIEIIVNNVNKLKTAGYTSIPKHIEEALLIWYSSQKTMPDLGGLMISQKTADRFDEYVATYKILKQTSTLSSDKMEKLFGDTFWFYFHFK